MGRKKKTSETFGYQDLFSEPIQEEKWDTICPLCGKKFLRTKEHCYLVDNKIVCSWKCFFTQVTKWEKEKIRLKENQPQRGRKPKSKIEVIEENDEDVL